MRERADPEIDGVHGRQVLGEVDDKRGADGRDEAQQRDRRPAFQPEPFLQQRDGRLEHRQRAGQRRQEQQEEEKEADDPPRRHLVEHVGQRDEAQFESGGRILAARRSPGTRRRREW